MQPIDTFYNDHYFRSRLEAKWAVFFDMLGELWEYEPEGFVLPNGVQYLPDFYLPSLDCYVEIKPQKYFDFGSYLLNPTPIELLTVLYKYDYIEKWLPFSIGKPLLVLFGLPHMKPSYLLYGNNGHIEHTENNPGYYATYFMGEYKCVNDDLYIKYKNDFKPHLAHFFLPCRLVLPFAYISKESYGKFWYAGGDENWYDVEPFQSAIITAKTKRF